MRLENKHKLLRFFMISRALNFLPLEIILFSSTLGLQSVLLLNHVERKNGDS